MLWPFAEAVRAMTLPAPAVDLYVNIGTDGPSTNDVGNPQSPYHAPLDLFEEQLAPFAKLLAAALGGLELAHVNLWLGAASTGSTSGMHLDPYDNVLVVMNGTKQIVLWDPSAAATVATAPKVVSILPDGRMATAIQSNVGSSVCRRVVCSRDLLS